MPVGLSAPESLAPIDGVWVGTAASGARKEHRDDLTLFAFSGDTEVAATFTDNAFCAAPVLVAREHLRQARPRYLLVNVGSANAGTGEPGIADARRCCALVADALSGPDDQVQADSVLPFSTGVIGEPLPMERIARAIPFACESLKPDGWLEAALAILTTDILPKGISLSKRIGGRQVRLTGIAKGSGMIHPNMATMLAFIATDAKVEAQVLEAVLQRAVHRSFNRISVDGDTSTNDACVLAATGAADNQPIALDSPECAAFADLVCEATAFLSQAIVRDGEGATKFVEIEVIEGENENECLQVAKTVAHSPLVKTALYAGDANWGRILAAVGRAGLADLDIARIRIWLGEVCIVSAGARDPKYREEAGAAVLAREEIRIRIALGRGKAADRMWTCDFSHDYVSINADYRS
ncbi:bifunctional glutamate N-acetyltransferase/amino-acid acetyltransferase ArgJ [Thioalkalivibrio sp. HK1]|uniref:bifunctional glutamate N-acetyltransferase/amino-acid acetyltransferase ArgJ n=1 Tax=Thioalkalivibrio sp. HK1 TaxID=1469245 RepID=UPI000470E77C|nr:bifunctional glutamate N-acetyltransferase/amino-acid acetyltransferase ArgJ [Thioalkalivibrio sp. HK1]